MLIVIPNGNVKRAVFGETLLSFSIRSNATGKAAADEAVENAIIVTGIIAL